MCWNTLVDLLVHNSLSSKKRTFCPYAADDDVMLLIPLQMLMMSLAMVLIMITTMMTMMMMTHKVMPIMTALLLML